MRYPQRQRITKEEEKRLVYVGDQNANQSDITLCQPQPCKVVGGE